MMNKNRKPVRTPRTIAKTSEGFTGGPTHHYLSRSVLKKIQNNPVLFDIVFIETNDSYRNRLRSLILKRFSNPDFAKLSHSSKSEVSVAYPSKNLRKVSIKSTGKFESFEGLK